MCRLLLSARQHKPPNPRAASRRFQREPTQLRLYPAVRRHQQHGFLLTAALTEGDQPAVVRSPVGSADPQDSGQLRTDDHQKEIRRLGSSQHAFEKQFVLPHPYARVSAFENAVNHSGGMIWVKTASPVKACVAHDLRPLPHAARYFHAGRVVIRGFGKALYMAGKFSQAPAPHTPEACDRDQHFYTSLSRLFFSRSTYSCSCRLLMCLTTLGSALLSSTDAPAMPLATGFTDMPSTRRDNAVRVRSFVANFVFVSFSSRKYSSLSPTTRLSSTLHDSWPVSTPSTAVPCWAASIARLQRSMCWLYFWIAFSATSRE